MNLTAYCIEIILYICCIIGPLTGMAQDVYVIDKVLENRNKTYDSNIKSAQAFASIGLLSYPVIELNSNQSVVFQFDDLEGDSKNYNYTIKHCRHDWTLSDLREYEYIDGFSQEDVESYNYSFNTTQDYTHYELTIPNDFLSLTKSGNYLLVVFKDDDPEDLVLSMRFCVVEQRVDLDYRFLRPQWQQIISTHQRINFEIEADGLDIKNPYDEVLVNVVQNWKWDQSLSGLKPFTAIGSSLRFNQSGKQIFPAGKEFRYVDMRSFQMYTKKIDYINETDSGNYVYLKADEPYYNSDYNFWEDINGKYVVEAMRQNNDNLQSDYAWVEFELAMEEPLKDANVYVYGEMTDWDCSNANKMSYDYENGSYKCSLYLKQGFYNYQYLAWFDESDSPDEVAIDGSHYTAENDYLIFVYYRPFNAQYDRLVGFRQVNSRN